MKEYIDGFCVRFGYPEEARAALVAAYDEITEDPELSALFHGGLREYEADRWTSAEPFRALLDELRARSGRPHYYASHLLFFICCSRHLLELYRREGISEEIWFDSMCDLKWKLFECRKLHGQWGSFVAPWFIGFFLLRRFALGRFQFEPDTLRCEYRYGEYLFPAGTPCVNFHIPNCGSISREIKDDSFARAEAFFRGRCPEGLTVFTCSSWLLYPHNRELLSSGGIIDFMNDFDIIFSENDPSYHDFWRIFYKEFDGSFEGYPQETRLQRAYLARMREGLPGGEGYGVILWKDGRILNRTRSAHTLQ